MGPRVAVAMAVYNDAAYLTKSLAALAQQTFRDFEVTVVDDGSTDDSASIAESYAAQISLRVHREAHRGRHDAKQLSWQLAAADAPYLLVLDSDMALPPDAIERMVALLDAEPEIAAVSAQQRSDPNRPHGRWQAFLEDLFLLSNSDEHGNSQWIQGGSVMLRRAALATTTVTGALGEDNELSVQLRDRWKIRNPRDLVATHYGVPTTLRGVLKKYYREGIRVRSLMRAYPGTRQLGNLARLVPLPLAAVGLASAATGQYWLVAISGAGLVAYQVAFLVASRGVQAPLADRLAGAFFFTVGNLGFGAGYFREALRGDAVTVMHEPNRTF